MSIGGSFANLASKLRYPKKYLAGTRWIRVGKRIADLHPRIGTSIKARLALKEFSDQNLTYNSALARPS